MSVLIKGMEMPTSCSRCICCRGSNYSQCTRLNRFVDWEYWHNTKPKDCPLVEIAAPHGDLIDKNEVIEYCYRLINAEQPDPMNYGQERVNQTEVIIHHMEFGSPTVIEAEQ